MSVTDLLLMRAEQNNIRLTQKQADDLTFYHCMLIVANARTNLTRVSGDPIEAIDRNYLDSIAPIPKGALDGVRRVIDVGSGAGFPGIPLSICLPEVHFVLLDSLGKRVKFLNSVIEKLHLNAEAVQLRAEDAARMEIYREQFDAAVARAVAPMNILSEYLLPFVRVGGRMIAYKGPTLTEELVQAENALTVLGGRVREEISVPMFERDWDHRIAVIEKIAATPEKYPRRAGVAEKKPL